MLLLLRSYLDVTRQLPTRASETPIPEKVASEIFSGSPESFAWTLVSVSLSNMPWSEKQSLQLRAEAFNVTNTQHFGPMDLSRSGYGIRLDPAVRNLTPPTNWSNLTDIQGGGLNGRRELQAGARFSF